MEYMHTKWKATLHSIKFKFIVAIIIVEEFSSCIGQGINFAIAVGRSSLETVGVGTKALDNVKEVMKQLSERADASLISSKEIESRADGMIGKVEKSLLQANDTYEEKQRKIKDAIEAGKIVEEIKVMSDTIRNISSQTNLLALDASIEAARAGENGKGFAVATERVKMLANQSAAAIANIEEIVDQVQSVFRNISASSMEVLDYIEEDVKADYQLLLQTGKKYKEDASVIVTISSEMNHSSNQADFEMNKMEQTMTKVYCVSKNNSSTSTQISNSIVYINETMTETYDSMKEQVKSARRLNDIIGKFTLGS